MGSASSSRRNISSFSSSSSSHAGYQRSPYPQQPPYYTPQPHHAPASFNYGARTPQPYQKSDSRYSRIADNYETLDQVTAALSEAGLESSNLIVGIDVTKSNEWTGARSFKHKSLHHMGNVQNPYEQAISIIGKTLSAFDEDNLIPCFGFGDASTHDQDVFSFYPDARSCNGFEEVLGRYRELVPRLRLSGPTSFAPIIEMAMRIVEDSVGQYHVLLIIADGQVTRSTETPRGQLSQQEQKTVDAIVRASDYPLSIILVGVGDGPWDMMREFDDNIPARAFDNFQFVNFTEIMSKDVDPLRKQAEFALAALMEIPSQYKATIELDMLGCETKKAPGRRPLPPPIYGSSLKSCRPNSFQRSAQSYPYPFPEIAAQKAPSSSSLPDNKVCTICLGSTKDLAFECGHQACYNCGIDLQSCPICQMPITIKIKLYS
ncbi:E3 ubiquitin-protein ligase RGLG5 [Coffea eugenioides]|uniref:E3 ubiquitin-protein ligase RGLG5-like isoform X1 n=1 Tax=Coffea arabica TaxID=13443 RepID=A0A6P6V3T0_COFAR|nr:E3 ubiquitin-protein ligase RGLG5 [Coffea eugenioides]XP_027154794.1 E3 ubiquitin-protein ligase RGLG5 [Coffea eugenioides]XP_027154795.1 E3 ubiquitin-protein ligase RGLG5 [Coffea eugenioides]XP_027154796.1 E3 ubiquitin-protein ligase RGLG5 [Coffea eugenioides]XP_027154797.1 E3 ubiquitin-protein ligase RGLG5 [Coffea eugenioides]